MIRDAEWLWARVDVRSETECWPWRLSLNQSRSPAFKVDHKNYLAHRLAWEVTNGPIPAGLLVCHHCDNPPCCNPAHLFLGTQQDNMDDMKRKGRQNGPKGVRNVNARLTVEKVRLMRWMAVHGASNAELGRLFGVSQPTAYYTVKGRNWPDPSI